MHFALDSGQKKNEMPEELRMEHQNMEQLGFLPVSVKQAE